MAGSRPPSLWVPLRNAEFRVLFVAETQSVAGDQLAKVALAILVYDRTGSPLWTAIVYSLNFVPALLGGIGLARIADILPRREVLAVAALAQGALLVLMAVPGVPLVVLCVLVFAVQLIGSVSHAAMVSLGRDVFADTPEYLRSQDLRSMSTNTVMLCGLAAGGLLVTVIGPSWALLLDAATFLFMGMSAWAFLARRPAARTVSPEKGEGAVRWLFGRSRPRLLLAFACLVGFAVVPEGLAAPLADQVGLGDRGVGLLLAADPLGFVIGVFVLSRLLDAEQRSRALGPLAVASVALLVAFWLQPHPVLALALLMLSGTAGAYIVTANALFTTMVPDAIRASAIGLYRTGLRVAQGIGVGLGGVFAEASGSVTGTVGAMAAAGTLLAVLVAIAWARASARVAPGSSGGTAAG
ncbi:MAG: MFS transporter [Streptosporangiales bacterium]|nr:MFS transporter [Streptosporangiales bacterium]